MMAFQRCSGWQWSTGALGDVEDDAAVADGQFVGHGADLGRDVGVAGGPVAGVVADDGVHPRRDAEAVEVGLARAQSGAARRIVGGRDVGSDEVDGRLVQAAGRFAGLIADDDSALRIRGGGVDAGEGHGRPVDPRRVVVGAEQDDRTVRGDFVEPVGPAEVAGQGLLPAESRVHVGVDEAGGEQAAGGGDGAGRRRLGSARADLADESVPDAHSALGPERVPVEDGDIEDIEIHCCLPTALSKLGRGAVAAFRRGSSAASGGGASRSQGPVREDDPKVCPESLFSTLAEDRR
jgi:hypothetical protein